MVKNQVVRYDNSSEKSGTVHSHDYGNNYDIADGNTKLDWIVKRYQDDIDNTFESELDWNMR